ncbi:transthyretin-like family protein [Flavilitoribacter nigricans]|uniref:Carboxypeptidase regulatory-like domain-containing protein n=1 Tax=Flavilitoribacter nigricans (strain ATCC 23147 / DSM 23189 / NBRC 102662 / NCIMB 1420 / SS-2) TaxID=1122177 RepID=A0A2D0NB06_FLAN2|nr:carboxypeptidase-like regulatory domain-containing protein [Flavilitoribacter nigricans]PHN04953.1 hypothetical protein CRP01_18145 [Flavilitoribacter nigricans DSM 23189 = NBRC 102662]
MKRLKWIAFLFLLLACNEDTLDVRITGRVTDAGEPVAGLHLYLTNYYYEGGDYDSFMPAEHYTLTTDRAGYFSIDLPRSAYIQIDTARKWNSRFYHDRYIGLRKQTINFDLSR